MIIELLEKPKKQFRVFAIYWANSYRTGAPVWHRHYFVLDYAEDGGFHVYSDYDTKIVDPTMDHFVLIKDAYDTDMFVHRAAYDKEEKLLDGLVDEGGYDAIDVFLDNLETMGIEHSYERTWPRSKSNYYEKFLMKTFN